SPWSPTPTSSRCSSTPRSPRPTAWPSSPTGCGASRDRRWRLPDRCACPPHFCRSGAHRSRSVTGLDGGVVPMTVLYPAIDLRGGRCVRLHRGDYAQETVYGDDPVAQALAFADAGAAWVHVVDLDAARSGDPANRPVIAKVAAALAERGVAVQTGGGVRSV